MSWDKRSLTKVLEKFILIALLLMDYSKAGIPSLEESRKLQFQRFLNQNDREQNEQTNSGGDSLKSSRARFKPVQTYDEPVKLRQLIESLLEVQCTSTDMTVKLHYDSSYSKLTPTLVDALSGGLLYVGSSESDTTCRGRSDEQAGEIKLTMGYGSCGMDTDHISDSTILYSTTVNVEFGNWSSSDHMRNFREAYKMTCVNPLDDDKKKKETHVLKLFEQKYDEIPFSIFPHTVERGSDIFLQGEVVLSNGYNSSDLNSFPVNCWLTQHAGYVDEQFRRSFLSQGCPANDFRGRGLSRVHHMVDGRTRVSFAMVSSLLWPEQQQNVYVQCELLSCVQSYTGGIVGVPKCPSTTYCAGIPQLSHTLPEHLRNSVKYTVVAGSLNVILKQHHEQQESSFVDSPAITNIDLKCQLACAQTQSSLDQRQSSAEAQSQQPGVQTFYVEGVSTKLVVIISFASFLIGMLMMGALWFVHVRTDPKRQLPKFGGSAAANSSTNSNVCRKASPLNCNDRNLQQTAKLMLNPL